MKRLTSRSRSATLLCIAAIAAIGVSGCAAPELSKKTDDGYQKALGSAMLLEPSTSLAQQAGPGVRGGAAHADGAAAIQRSMPVVRRASAPFIGSQMVPATSEDRLPSIFQEPFTIDFSDAARDGSGGVSLSIAMARLSRLSGVPIRIQPDVYTGGEEPGKGVAAAKPSLLPGSPMPSPLLVNQTPGATSTVFIQPASSAQGAGADKAPHPLPAQAAEPISTVRPVTLRSVEMKYQGTRAGYLNMLTDRLGLAWEYRDNTIVISRFVIEMHEVFAVAGSSKYSMGSSGSSTGSAGGDGATGTSQSSAESSEKGESNVMETMAKAITAMIAEVPGSTVTRSDGSGRLVVKTSREMQSRVRDYIKSENNSMRRQAQIQFDIYSVTDENADQHGIDWKAALRSLSFPALAFGGGSPTTLTDATVGSASVSVIGGLDGSLSRALGDSSVIIQALAQNGYSAQHRPISLMALNRQWATASRLGTEYYLSETTPGPASSTGVGAPGLKTDKITTGDRYIVMPQILDDNTIMLKFDMSLSDLLGLFDVTVGTGLTAQKVQAPKTSAVSIRMPVAIRPGEVVAITGLSRDVVSSDTRRLAENLPVEAGGSRSISTKREYFLIFVRAVVL